MNRRLLDLAITKTAFEFLKNLGLLNFFSCCGAHRFGAKLDISHFISFLDFHIENRNMMKLALPTFLGECKKNSIEDNDINSGYIEDKGNCRNTCIYISPTKD